MASAMPIQSKTGTKHSPLTKVKTQALEVKAAANVASPKGISYKAPITQVQSDHSLSLQRRRLTVVSDNTLVEGMSQLTTKQNTEETGDGVSAITCYAGVSKKGYAPYNPRKKNQDALIIRQDPITKSLLLCVFDGHGEAGDAVSNALKDKLPQVLFNNAQFKDVSGDLETDKLKIQSAITEALSNVEKEIIKDSSIETDFSGTTAVITIIRGNLLVVGNVGDSRITRGYMDTSKPTETSASATISIDHKPDRADERARILAAGGRVFAVEYDDGIDGPPRVWLGHMDAPGLAMSRSVGDTVAHTAGVSSEPEYFTHYFDKNDRNLVIATDGLWEFMSIEEVHNIVSEHTNPKIAVDLLVNEANRRWMREEQVVDDTSVIVAYIDTNKMAAST